MVELGLIGYPLGHSFSPRYFENKFRLEGVEGRYDLYPISDISLLPELLDRHPGLLGLNVTIPYKEQVLPYLDHLSDDARAIGAVNVIKIDRTADGTRILSGHNTDWQGFLQPLLPLLHGNCRRALVLGTGGASKGVCYALQTQGIATTLVSRRPAPGSGMIGYDQITREVIEDHKIIVNATPRGMFPNVDDAPDLDYGYITPRHICYDLIYNPEETQFMRRSRRQGAVVKNGLEMLHRQADIAYDIWMQR